jgi:hypothetical protein
MVRDSVKSPDLLIHHQEYLVGRTFSGKLVTCRASIVAPPLETKQTCALRKTMKIGRPETRPQGLLLYFFLGALFDSLGILATDIRVRAISG